MKLHIGKASRNPKTGEIGAPVFVSLKRENGWDGEYRFSTRGMKPEDVQAKVQEIRAHHAAKAVRLTGFADVRGVKIAIGKRAFVIVDCTIWEAGGGVELYLDVREDDRRVAGFPVIHRFAKVEDVPDNGLIVEIARVVISEQVDVESKHADFVARTSALLDLGG